MAALVHPARSVRRFQFCRVCAGCPAIATPSPRVQGAELRTAATGPCFSPVNSGRSALTVFVVSVKISPYHTIPPGSAWDRPGPP